jgi:hypothetical protein
VACVFNSSKSVEGRHGAERIVDISGRCRNAARPMGRRETNAPETKNLPIILHNKPLPDATIAIQQAD